MKTLLIILAIFVVIAVGSYDNDSAPKKHESGHIEGSHEGMPHFSIIHAQAVLRDSGIDGTHPCFSNIQHYLMYQVKEELTVECKSVNIE